MVLAEIGILVFFLVLVAVGAYVATSSFARAEDARRRARHDQESRDDDGG